MKLIHTKHPKYFFLDRGFVVGKQIYEEKTELYKVTPLYRILVNCGYVNAGGRFVYITILKNRKKKQIRWKKVDGKHYSGDFKLIDTLEFLNKYEAQT